MVDISRRLGMVALGAMCALGLALGDFRVRRAPLRLPALSRQRRPARDGRTGVIASVGYVPLWVFPLGLALGLGAAWAIDRLLRRFEEKRP
jgi:hypothetical protein